ncbi:MAG: UPF0179 family protein [Candidatus Bathyarchaeota archaeon]
MATSKVRRNLTLISVGKAKKGYTFIYQGLAVECLNCSLLKVCHNLQPGKCYTVVDVRDRIFECKLSGGEVCLVEVESASLKVNIKQKFAIEGAIIEFSPQKCSNIQCEMFNDCVPQVLQAGLKCKVIKIYGTVKCPVNGQVFVQVLILPL